MNEGVDWVFGFGLSLDRRDGLGAGFGAWWLGDGTWFGDGGFDLSVVRGWDGGNSFGDFGGGEFFDFELWGSSWKPNGELRVESGEWKIFGCVLRRETAGNEKGILFYA